MFKNRLIWLFLVAIGLTGCLSPQRQSQDVTDADSIQKTQNPDTQKVTVMENGLKIQIVLEGEGEEIKSGAVASVHYTGWLYDEAAPEGKGDKFDSSRDRGEPFAFNLGAGQVIQGWDQGVEGMKVGEQRLLTIPPELGYGERGAGSTIPPGSTLLFEVELVEIGLR
ncbi:MAG: hypothetical protein BMS9Abin05_0176 [Rhodothermia bacterium]|nr:MAG: hypothetical protein BMS9Abin05_0176 [Rhodothermia bacterium]